MAEKTNEPANPLTADYVDAVEEGYLGQPPDPAPNESYTVAGGTGAATPQSKKSKSD